MNGFKRISKLVVSLGIIFSLAACATAYDKRGVYHRVRKGDSIWKIAKYYHVSVQDIAEWNNIHDPDEIIEGLKLYIPTAGKSKKSRFSKKSKSKRDSISYDLSKFIWPVKGVVFSNFGVRRGRRHDGIDISAPKGTPIVAADDGRVVFNGRMRGYGNMIILKHRDRYFTVYAHNSRNTVEKGKRVDRGDVIAYVGRTGRASGNHLHFEVRQGQRARNPIYFLPAKVTDGVRIVERSKKAGNYEKKAVKSRSKKKRNKITRRQIMMKKAKAKK